MVARDLLKAGAAVNHAANNGFTALITAFLNGHELVARALLEAKGDPNKATKLGTTALMKTSENGHELVARTLIENGADLERETQPQRQPDWRHRPSSLRHCA